MASNACRFLGRLRQHKLKRVTDTDIGRPVTCARFDHDIAGILGKAAAIRAA
jgi:hypothetical protein